MMKSTKNKMWLCLLLACVLAFSLCSCSDGGQPTSSQSAGSGGGASAEDFTPVQWRMANMHPNDSFVTEMDQQLCKDIEEATEGRVSITLYTDSQLGDYTSVFEEIMVGSIEMAHITPVEAYDSRLIGAYLPYLAFEFSDMKEVLSPDNYLFQTCADIERGLGIELLGFFVEGFNGIGSAKQVTEPGVPGANKQAMIRVAAMDTYTTCNEVLGFQTSNIPYSDTYTAIQTNLVDGWAGGPPNLNYLYFRDVIKYFYDYRQCCEVNNYHVNASAFGALLPEDQAAIRELCYAACEKSFELAEADTQKYKDMLRDANVEVVEFTEAEYEAMATAVREEAWPQLADSFTQEFLDSLLASLPA